MKRIIPGIRNIGDRASALGEAAKSAARRMEEFRQTMAASTSQLESLKAEMPLCVADLRTDREDRLSAAMVEIGDADDLFAKAGYAIDGIDLEISPAQRLILHLLQTRRVDPAEISRLMRSQPPGTLRAVLSALVRARQTADAMAPGGLPDHSVVIGLGPIPSVRLSWRNGTYPVATTASPVNNAAAQRAFATDSSGGFFGQPVADAATAHPLEACPAPDAEPKAAAEKPSAAHAESAVSTHAQSAPDTAPSPLSGIDAHESSPPVEPPAPEDPLARFKKMPVLSR